MIGPHEDLDSHWRRFWGNRMPEGPPVVHVVPHDPKCDGEKFPEQRQQLAEQEKAELDSFGI